MCCNGNDYLLIFTLIRLIPSYFAFLNAATLLFFGCFTCRDLDSFFQVVFSAGNLMNFAQEFHLKHSSTRLAQIEMYFEKTWQNKTCFLLLRRVGNAASLTDCCTKFSVWRLKKKELPLRVNFSKTELRTICAPNKITKNFGHFWLIIFHEVKSF